MTSSSFLLWKNKTLKRQNLISVKNLLILIPRCFYTVLHQGVVVFMGKMRCDEFQSSLMDFLSSSLRDFVCEAHKKINFTLNSENSNNGRKTFFLRCDFSFSNYDKDLTMTVILFYERAALTLFHS